jgi:outer membrane protein
MSIKTIAIAACAGAAALGFGTTVLAQTPAAAPAQTQISYGPVIGGVCTLSTDAVLANSTVGKYVEGRLQQIQAQVNAELSGEQSGIDTEAKTLDGQRGTLDQGTLEQRASALQVRYNALQRKAALRDRELQATVQQAQGRIINEMKPLIASAAESQKCSVLFDRSAVILVNPAMDLTPAVVTALNGKLTQFAFDRTRLDQSQAGAAPPVAEVPAQKPVARK